MYKNASKAGKTLIDGSRQNRENAALFLAR